MDLLEVCKRLQEGRVASEDSFDLDSVYLNLARLVDKYDNEGNGAVKN